MFFFLYKNLPSFIYKIYIILYLFLYIYIYFSVATYSLKKYLQYLIEIVHGHFLIFVYIIITSFKHGWHIFFGCLQKVHLLTPPSYTCTQLLCYIHSLAIHQKGISFCKQESVETGEPTIIRNTFTYSNIVIRLRIQAN